MRLDGVNQLTPVVCERLLTYQRIRFPHKGSCVLVSDLLRQEP